MAFQPRHQYMYAYSLDGGAMGRRAYIYISPGDVADPGIPEGQRMWRGMGVPLPHGDCAFPAPGVWLFKLYMLGALRKCGIAEWHT